MSTRECPGCKAKLDPAYAFCPECGSPVPAAPAPAPEPPKPAKGGKTTQAREARHADEPAWAANAQAAPEPDPAPAAAAAAAPAPAPVPAAAAPAAPAADLEDSATLEAGRRPDLAPPRKKTESAPRSRTVGPKFRLVRLARGGGHSAEHELPDAGMSIGRGGADLAFADDPAVSPRHVELRPVGNHVEVREVSSTNGLYVRIRAEHRLAEGDLFICGDSVFRVSVAPARFDSTEYRLYAAPQEKTVLATVTRILADGSDGEVWPVRAVPFLFGREEGDVRCGADRFMSRKHAVIQSGRDGLMLADMKSRNGTYIRRRGDLSLADGDVMMVGRQLLRIEALAQ